MTAATAIEPTAPSMRRHGALPAVLTADEILAVARLDGCMPPSSFDTQWTNDELEVATAVALRGLLARGYAGMKDSVDGPDVSLTAAAREAFGPLLRPDAVVEVTYESVGTATYRRVVAESAGAAIVAQEREPSVWQLQPVAEPAEPVAWAIASTLLYQLSTVQANSATPRITLDVKALLDATMLITQSNADAALELLTRQGLDRETSAHLVGILQARTAALTVRLLRRIDTTQIAGSVCCLDAGPFGLWLIEPATDGDPDDDTGVPQRCALVAVDRTTVRAAVRELLTPRRP